MLSLGWSTTIAALLASANSLIRERDHAPHGLYSWPHNHELADEYDYVIVGGGVAGMVLAEQLSEDPRISVLLLEAGPDGTNSSTINTPAYAALNDHTPYTWNYTSQPDPNLNGARPALAQGHTWGGGSAVNYMAYCRGAASTFNEWADISGDPGLAWANLSQEFKATTRYEEPNNTSYQEVINTSLYGDGPLIVSRQLDLGGFDPYYHEALMAELDLQNVDLNIGTGIGATLGYQTVRPSNRTRYYALEAYGWRMAGRPNVQLLHSAWASKIGFEDKRARSVTYVTLNDKQTHVINAKEVIVSSGALGSPKLLMLSGIGPREHLEDLGIPVVLDAPDVGSNLYDHHFSVVEVEVTPNVNSAHKFSNATYLAEVTAQYKDTATGILANVLSGSFAVARVPDDVLEAANDTFHLSIPPDRGHLLYQFAGAAFVQPAPNTSILSPFVSLVQPEASGYLRLNGTDFMNDPLIYSNYYGSDGDKAAILYGYKKLRAVLQSPLLADVIVGEVFPGANVTTDVELMEAIKRSAQTFHHPLGTVSMGKVLDSDFRIRGLDGIRVVDSSTFPYPPVCHLQADVYAVAHMVARAIMEEDYSRVHAERSGT